ncbi:MAG: glycosyltransferase [Sandaracinaceae bacterium]
MTGWLLDFAVFLLLYFGGYWAAVYTLVLVHAVARTERTSASGVDHGAVRILVPSHHEGDTVVDTVRTLLEQDYVGDLVVEVLVRDFEDETVAALCRVFGEGKSDGRQRELPTRLNRRRLFATAVGRPEKHAKLNHAIPTAPEPFVALLDADHRARPSWIAVALERLTRDDAAGVQCRKRPLATSRLAQMWDAGFSHTAFELFNHSVSRSFGRVAFTGSTAVFRADVLKAHPFHDCITEDTYLSYDLLLGGLALVYEPDTGSYEEATPNIPSFVFRRRRWAAGHSHAFFAHLGALWASRPPWGTRVLVAFGGQFFLLPVAVALFFLTQGVYYFLLVTVEVRAVVLLVSAALAVGLTLWLSWRRSTKLTDALVLWLMVFPHVSMQGALVYLLLDQEPYYFLSAFPFESQLWSVQAGLLLSALTTFVVAHIKLRALPHRHALLFLLTAPLVIFFELASALLGFSDMLLQRRTWSRIDRAEEHDAVDESMRGRLQTTVHRGPRQRAWLLVLPVTLVALVVINDVLSIGPCGDRTPLLWDPILLQPDDPPVLRLEIERTPRGDLLEVVLRAHIRSGERGPLSLRFFDGDRALAQREVSDGSSHEARLTWPLGWSTRTIRVSLAGPGRQCLVEREVATRSVELSDSGLRVNGEPFPIKGMVATFSAPDIGLPLDAGYRQLREAGVNTVRLYHPPTDAVLAAAQRQHMLLIPQPEGSTWESLDADSAWDRALYRRRWRAFVSETEGHPYVLMRNTGNELEIHDRSRENVAALGRVLRDAGRENQDGLTTYATFATFVDYPVDVIGINMLDTGATYWGPALDLVGHSGRPFFASELGGFVAFFEDPPSVVRRWRMLRQSDELERRGALGAVYFASHDNWAQAVPPGSYNDPFTGDHPDDRRGYWAPNNAPKPELRTLTRLLADVHLSAAPTPLAADTDEVRVRVENVRTHALRAVELSLGRGRWVPVGELGPHGHAELSLPLDALRASANYPEVEVRYRATSHHGLPSEGRWRFSVPDTGLGPVLLTDVEHDVERGDNALRIAPLEAGPARLFLPPEWGSANVGGETEVDTGEGIELTLDSPRRALSGVSYSLDGDTFAPFDGAAIGEGTLFLRLSLPFAPGRSERFLVLSGLAATRVFAQWEGGTSVHPAHPYRDTLIPLAGRSGVVTLRFQRRRARYLPAASSPTGRGVSIELAAPYVFDTRRLEVRRGSN